MTRPTPTYEEEGKHPPVVVKNTTTNSIIMGRTRRGGGGGGGLNDDEENDGVGVEQNNSTTHHHRGDDDGSEHHIVGRGRRRRRRRSCIGVLADSSARRHVGAPPVCVGVPFRERDDGSWDDDDDVVNDDAMRTTFKKKNNTRDGWKFACVGYGSAAAPGTTRTSSNAMEEDDELPKCRGLEILVSEHVLDDGDWMHETDEERARRMRLSRDERRRRGADAKEEEDFIVDLHHKPDETRRRKIDGTRPTTSEDTIAERRRQHQLKRRVVDAEHKLPNELNNFDQRFIAQSKLIWKRMEKHAKYVYSGAFMKDL